MIYGSAYHLKIPFIIRSTIMLYLNELKSFKYHYTKICLNHIMQHNFLFFLPEGLLQGDYKSSSLNISLHWLVYITARFFFTTPCNKIITNCPPRFLIQVEKNLQFCCWRHLSQFDKKWENLEKVSKIMGRLEHPNVCPVLGRGAGGVHPQTNSMQQENIDSFEFDCIFVCFTAYV